MGWLFPAELMKLLFFTLFLSGFGKLGLEPCSQHWVLAGERDSFVWRPVWRKASLPALLPVMTPRCTLCSKHGSLPLICALLSPFSPFFSLPSSEGDWEQTKARAKSGANGSHAARSAPYLAGAAKAMLKRDVRPER